MTDPCERNDLIDRNIIHLLLDQYLLRCEGGERECIRGIALQGMKHALQTMFNWLDALRHDDDTTKSLFNYQLGLSEMVVSKGGLNDAARTYLRTSNFANNLRQLNYGNDTGESVQFGGFRASGCSSNIEDAKRWVSAKSFYPCIVGSGRLAACVLNGLSQLGVPNENVTIVSRSHLSQNTAPFTWMKELNGKKAVLGLDRYRQNRYTDDVPILGGKDGCMFLLSKRKAFQDEAIDGWYKRFREENGDSVVFNMMAGGALNMDDESEIVVRGNVLMSQRYGGNLILSKASERRLSSKNQRVLNHVGQVFVAPDCKVQAQLTFFTSTVPLVLFTELDKAILSDTKLAKVSNSYVLGKIVRRIQVVTRILESGPTDERLCKDIIDQSGLKENLLTYMEKYFGMEK